MGNEQRAVFVPFVLLNKRDSGEGFGCIVH